MIDTTKAKADAEEGLRIAEDATDGPWELWEGNFSVHAGPSTQNNPGCIAGCRAEICEADSFQIECESEAEGCDDDDDVDDHAESVTSANLTFIADSRTRAPEAYRNVIALAEENERLRAEVARCGKLELDHLRIDSLRLGDLIAMQEKVTALEAEVARMKPLIAATFAWVETEGIDGDNALLDAVNSYEASPTP